MRIILDQFLELSRLDSEKSEPFIVQNIAQLVTEVANKYLRANAPISVLIQSTAIVKFKPMALTRLLYNLIDNALRHGAGGARVEVRSDGQYASISVANDANIQAEESALISALRWVGGRQQSGLGSAIIHRISDVHGARLIVDSENPEVFEVSIQFKIAA
jgi:signal transduction histidine kinase